MPFLYHLSDEGELMAGLMSKISGGPLGCRAFSSWTLFSLKLGWGQAWVSPGCSHLCVSVHFDLAWK